MHKFIYICIIIVFGLVIINKYALKTLIRDKDGILGYIIGQELSKTMKSEEIVFVSGTSVFWLNSFFDIRQIRGGVDQV